MNFIECKDYKSLLCGGVGSGKTYGGALKSREYILKNPGCVGIVTAPTYKILTDATIPVYHHVFPDWMIKRITTRPYPRMYLVNGSIINFISTHRPEMIAGVSAAFSHMDEASLSPYQAFLNIRERLRQINRKKEAYPYQIWMTTTPRQLNWLYHEVTDIKNPITMFTVATNENIYLPDAEDYIKKIGLEVGSKIYEQEILGKFVSLAGECLFDEDVLQRLLNQCESPVDHRDWIVIYREPVVGGKYIAALDTADEGGGGNSSLIIIDAQTGVEMAEINADVKADEAAQLAYDLCEEYYFPTLAVERNGTAGGMVLTKLQDLMYPRLYRDHNGKEGWYTTGKAAPPKVDRHNMLLEYEEAVRLRRTIPASTDAVGEMSTFVQNSKGKYEHRQGCLDDRVMSRAICWQMTKESRGVQEDLVCVFRDKSSYAPDNTQSSRGNIWW